MCGETRTDGTLTVNPGITQLDEDIFCVTGLYATLPKLTFPLRSTIIRLPGQRLVVYSPLNPDLIDLSSLGTIHAIIAPNTVHATYAIRMKEQNPAATLYSSPGLKERFPDRDWGTLITEGTPTGVVAPEIDVFCVTKMKPFQEVVVVHRRTKTLIIADLAFHVTPEYLKGAGPGVNAFCRVMRGMRKMDLSVPVKMMMRCHCKDALPEYEHLLEMDWDGVVPCHGELIRSGGKEAFRQGAFKFVKDSAETGGSWGLAFGVAVAAVIIGTLVFRGKWHSV